MNSNLGGFFVINLLTHRIIKEHKHYKTALNQWRKLGTDTHAIKPIADREAYLAQVKAVDMMSTRSVC
jgi:hypothetical protein